MDSGPRWETGVAEGMRAGDGWRKSARRQELPYRARAQREQTMAGVRCRWHLATSWTCSMHPRACMVIGIFFVRGRPEQNHPWFGVKSLDQYSGPALGTAKIAGSLLCP